MNSLIITVCVLIEATVIIAQPPRFSTTSPPEMLNTPALAAGYPSLPGKELNKPFVGYSSESTKSPPAQSPGSPYNTDTGILVHGYLKNVDHQISIVRQALDGPNPDGSYSYSYETGNGIQAQEDGHLNNVGTDQEALEARGSYSYTDNEGNTFQVSYVANENGFQPEGAHLPSVPPLIKRALQYIAEHPEENEKK